MQPMPVKKRCAQSSLARLDRMSLHCRRLQAMSGTSAVVASAAMT